MYFFKFWLLCFTLNVFLWLYCDKHVEKQVVIASVGDQTLTLDKMFQEIPVEIRPKLTNSDIREFVQRWINSQVLYQEAKRQKLDERIDLKNEFKKAKNELMINKLIELYLEEEVTVTDEEIQAFYEENKEEFVLNQDLVHAYHILGSTRKEANNIRRRLRSGETFEVVSRDVKQALEDTMAWDLGYFSRDDVIREISKVVFSMPRGALSLPIKSDFGYHIVKLIDKQKKGEFNKLENVNEEINLKLMAGKKRARYQRFLLELKNQTDIVTNFELLDTVKINSIDHAGAKGE